MPRPRLQIFLATALLAALGCRAAEHERPGRRAELLQRREQMEKELLRGLELASQGRHEEAIAAIFPLARAFESLRDSARSAEAMFWTGYCHEKLGRADDAASFYRAVASDYPGTPAARLSADRLAKIAPPGAP